MSRPPLLLAELLGILLLLAGEAFAMTGRVIAPDGGPLANAHVSIAGRPRSVATSESGTFVIEPDPEPPFTILVIGPRGEIYQPFEVTEAADGVEIRVSSQLSESITVTTGVAPDILTSPAAATTFIGRQDLEQRVTEHLIDAVVRVPGVDRRGEGPAAVPIVRGLGGGRTAIILDDARITAERRAGPSATFLDPFTLASIEIARGPGSVAYGSDAFGGVIHARSRDPEPGKTSLFYELTTGFGGSDTDSLGVSFSTPAGRAAVALTLHGRESDGSRGADGREIVNSQYSATGGSVRAILPIPSGAVRAAISIDRARDIGAPGAESGETLTYYPEEESNRLTFGLDRDTRSTRYELRGAIGTYDITTNRERLPIAATRRQISSAEVTAKDASLRATAATTTARAFFQTGLDVISRFDLRAAGSVTAFDERDVVQTRRHEVSIDRASRHDAGLFLIADVPWTRSLTFSGGARVDALAVRNEGGYFGSRSRSDQALSGHAALVWTAGAFTTTLQLASGFREPTLSDRYFRGVGGRGFITGNPDLEPERSLQVDYSGRWQRGQRSVALSAYHYRIEDLVERYAAEGGFAFRNRGEAEIRGVELEAAIPLSAHVAAHGSFSAARGESDGQPVDDITPLKIHAELRWTTGRGSMFSSASWFGADDRPGPVEVARPAYTTVDAGAGWKLRESADLRLAVRNLLDAQHAASADANAGPGVGRAVTLSLHGRF